MGGRFKSANTPTYFFLMDLHHFSRDLPDPVKFTTKLAEVHRKSVSPSGKFGFHVSTCKWKMVQDTRWNDSWAELFTRLMKDLHKAKVAINGSWME